MGIWNDYLCASHITFSQLTLANNLSGTCHKTTSLWRAEPTPSIARYHERMISCLASDLTAERSNISDVLVYQLLIRVCSRCWEPEPSRRLHMNAIREALVNGTELPPPSVEASSKSPKAESLKTLVEAPISTEIHILHSLDLPRFR